MIFLSYIRFSGKNIEIIGIAQLSFEEGYVNVRIVEPYMYV